MMKKTGNKKYNIFLNDGEKKKFNTFKEESGLTQTEMGELEGEGYGQQTMYERMKKPNIRRSFIKKVGIAKIKQMTKLAEEYKKLAEKYKGFFENL